MIRNSKYLYGPTDVYIPASVNFGAFILNKLSQWNDKVALISAATDEQTTYKTIFQESMNLAVSLTRLGVGRGDLVSVVTENRPEFWSSVVGVTCAGSAVSPISARYTTNEFKYAVDTIKPKIIICSPNSYKRYESTMKVLPFLNTIIVYGTERIRNVLLYNDLATMTDDGCRSDVALRCDVTAREFVPADVVGQSDVALVLYSSGTTGLSKGAMISNLNLIVQCSNANISIENLIELTVSPWFHARGLTSVLKSFVRGGTCVYLNKFNVDLYLKTIEKYKVNTISAVPAMLVALSKTKNSYDTRSLKLVYCGASPLYDETYKAFEKRFPSVEAILQDYGSTETLGVSLNDNPKKFSSVGTLVPHCVVKVVDIMTRKPLGAWKRGEICVKGLMVMKRYINEDRIKYFDHEGFYKTGDVGYYDDDKYLYIVDRIKDLIKYKGYQVTPAEIEMTLLQCEGVEDAGVVGVYHEDAGEVPCAFVVLQPGANLTEREIQDFVAARLSHPKHLRGRVRFVSEIPRSSSGKILRKELRRMLKTKSKL